MMMMMMMMVINIFSSAMLCQSSTTRGHSYKLYKAGCSKSVRSLFFTNRVINIWNGLPSNTDFSSLASFEHTIEMINCSQLLRYE